MKYNHNALNILAMLSYTGIGNAFIVENYKKDMSDDEIVKLINSKIKNDKEKINIDDFFDKKDEIKNKLDKLENNCTTFCDDDFPININTKTSKQKKDEDLFSGNTNDENSTKNKLDADRSRLQINKSDYPVCLFYKGDLNLLRKKTMNIAIIGLLNPNPQTLKIEEKIVDEFLKNDAVIISGLALGCDSIAHRRAIRENGVTVAILPSTIDNILPKENKELAEEIVNGGGLLVSEYYEEAKSPKELNNRYIKRDRLQALFSDMVVLTASYSKVDTETNKKKDSGSRHAMNKAKEYGIRRAVIYEEEFKDVESFNLNRELINEAAIEIKNIFKCENMKKLSTKDINDEIKKYISKISFSEYKDNKTADTIRDKLVKIYRDNISKDDILKINTHYRDFKILNGNNISDIASAFKKKLDKEGGKL